MIAKSITAQINEVLAEVGGVRDPEQATPAEKALAMEVLKLRGELWAAVAFGDEVIGLPPGTDDEGGV